MFKVIVAGGRDFSDYALLEKTLDNLLVNKSEVEIVSGLANGADKLGVHYARSQEVIPERVPC
jgi:predicted Rossmann fold nucleotide-binding protein DprA/Smf involved in DNA uptake